MTGDMRPVASPPPRVRMIAVHTLIDALRKGLRDYLRAPVYGLFFSAVYVLGVVLRQKDRQTPAMSVVVLFVFLVWLFVAHTIFALFLGLSAMVNVSQDPAGVLLTPDGLQMLALGTVIGAGFAAVLFSVTVVSLPYLLEKEVDFVTAMLTSLEVVVHNPQVMALWAAMIAGLLFVGMLPAFLGLFVVLPVLGHASWHVYRAALQHPGRQHARR